MPPISRRMRILIAMGSIIIAVIAVVSVVVAVTLRSKANADQSTPKPNMSATASSKWGPTKPTSTVRLPNIASNGTGSFTATVAGVSVVPGVVIPTVSAGDNGAIAKPDIAPLPGNHPGQPSQTTPAPSTPIEPVVVDPVATATPMPVSAFGQKFGIMYSLWHCPYSESQKYNPSGVIPDILLSYFLSQPWAPIPSFHWWSAPDVLFWQNKKDTKGYYCLAEDNPVLMDHALKLTAAGFDFVFVDMTNWPNQNGAQEMVMDPFLNMLKVWSSVVNAPRIVPWMKWDANGGDLINFVDENLQRYPLTFDYGGKPLLLVTSSPETVPDQIKARYTVRTMWGFISQDLQNGGEFSFLEPCSAGFKESGGNQPCSQYCTRDPATGEVEQVPVSPAVQNPVMSDSRSLPKLHGKTLVRMLETAYLNPQAKLVMVSGWNEWIAQRVCPNFTPAGCSDVNDALPNGHKVFVSEYDYEYSRDLEPGGGMGTFYYDLLVASMQLLRNGQNPIGAIDKVTYDAKIIGFIDTVSRTSTGGAIVTGWSCWTQSPQPIHVDIYAGEAGPTGVFIRRVRANSPSSDAERDAMSTMCNVKGTPTTFRFGVELSSVEIQNYIGRPVYAYGISPAGGSNDPLENSGRYTL